MEDRIEKLEREFGPPGSGSDLDIVVRTETSVRAPDGTIAHVPLAGQEFPEDYECTFCRANDDGSWYRVWEVKKKAPVTHGIVADEATQQ